MKIVGSIIRYFFAVLFIISSITVLNNGHVVRFIQVWGTGVLLLPVVYKTLNDKKVYKKKWEVLAPIIWFTVFAVILYLKNSH